MNNKKIIGIRLLSGENVICAVEAGVIDSPVNDNIVVTEPVLIAQGMVQESPDLAPQMKTGFVGPLFPFAAPTETEFTLNGAVILSRYKPAQEVETAYRSAFSGLIMPPAPSLIIPAR